MAKKKTQNPLLPEWSHKVDITHISATPQKLNIAASAEQCKDVARRLRVEKIVSLRATATLQRQGSSHIIYVAGTLEADIDQLCAVSGEKLESHVTEDFEAWYSDEENVVSLDRARREKTALLTEGEIPMADEKDDPEPVTDGHIDVGELAVQYLSLAIDPYLKGDLGAEPPAEAPPVKEGGWHNPFAALKDWKASKPGKDGEK